VVREFCTGMFSAVNAAEKQGHVYAYMRTLQFGNWD